MALRIGSGFKAKEEVTYRDVINITTNPPAQRTKKDIQAVSDWVGKRTAIFAEMDKDIVYNVVKNCKCQIMLRDTVVVRQGEKGDAFYIILHGQVSVFVKEVVEVQKSLLHELLASDDEEQGAKTPTPEPMSEHEEDEPPKPTGPSVRLRFRKTLTKLKITQQVTSKMKKKSTVKKPNPRDGLGQRVALMEDGRSFGELALLNSDNKREASCVAETDVVFMVVARELYNKSIKSFQARQMALVRGFVSQHPFFSHWPNRLQPQVLNSVTQVKLQPGETVLRQGESYDGIYFLIQGEVKVTVNSESHAKQYPNACRTDLDEGEIDRSKDRLFGHCEILRSLSMPHVHVKRREGYTAAERYQSNRHRDLCLSGPTIMFGDIEHILGVSTYMQTVTAESSTRLFHINKENWARLLKLASNMGHTVSAPTITAMTEMAYTTWAARLEKFAATIDRLSCLESMIKQLLDHPTMRVKSPTPQSLSKEEKSFESLVTAYLSNQAPLIQPCVEGGHQYRSLMHERVELRRKQRERRGGNKVALPHSLRPLQNRRIPRSIATLREQMKKFNTVDAEVLIPPTKRNTELEPIPLIQDRRDDGRKRGAASYHYGGPPLEHTKPATMEVDVSSFPQVKPAPEEIMPISENERMESGEESAWPNLIQIVEQEEQEEEEEMIRAPISVEPVLITERPHKCDSVELVQGKTLKFYSQYLKGRLDEEYDKPLIDVEVVQNNREADALERKLQLFIDPNNVLPDTTTAICKLHRLDEDRRTNLRPGGKCLIERTPCRLLRRGFPLKSHEHIRRHIVEN